MEKLTKFRDSVKPCKHCGGVLRYLAGGKCPGCNTFRQAKYRVNPQAKARHARQSASYSRTIRGRAKKLVIAARVRAKLRGIEFNLVSWLVESRVMYGICEVTGIPFEFGPPPKGCRVHPWGPSIDRIDNSKGYTSDNVQIVCNIFNIAKNDFANDDMLRMAVALVRKTGKVHQT